MNAMQGVNSLIDLNDVNYPKALNILSVVNGRINHKI
jgi:hypothetical protein